MTWKPVYTWMLLAVGGLYGESYGDYMGSNSVCSITKPHMQTYQKTYTNSYVQRYYVSCGTLGWNTCTRYRIAYRTQYETTYGTVYRTSYVCCKGWSLRGSTCSPHCSPECNDGERCIRPNVCDWAFGSALLRPANMAAKVAIRSADTCLIRDVPVNNVCEDQTFTLECGVGEIISVSSALYGRQSASICRRDPILTTSCAASNSLNVVQERCNGKQTCSVRASNGVFGDPCVGTFKYLEIQYSCEAACCPGCTNGGMCIRQDVCECPNGYIGYRCETLTNTCPDDITVPNDLGDAGAIVNWNGLKIDNANVTSTHASGDFFTIGSTIVRYRIENTTMSSTCSFAVNVLDMESPILTCPSNYMAFADSGTPTMTKVPVYWPSLNVTDNSGKVSGISCSKTSGFEFPIGSTDVQCLAIDQSGNNDTCGFQVHVHARCLEDITNTSKGLLSWQSTVAGNVAESNERCPVNTERRNFGIAFRECVLRPSVGAYWAAPVVNSCGEEQIPTAEDLAKTQVTEYNVDEVAATLANITEAANVKSDDLDIEAIQQTFVNIVNVGSPSPKVTEAVVEIVDNILDANISSQENRNSANASSSILKSFEEQVAQTLEKQGTFRSVQPNIVVEAVTINATEKRGGIGFAILGNQSVSGFQEGTTVNFDPEDEPLTANMTSSIQLPTDVFITNQSDSDTKISFVVYNTDKLFQSRRLERQPTSLIMGPVISAVVIGRTFVNLSQPVVVQIFPTKVGDTLRPTVLNTSICVFWDFNKYGGIGDWSEDGCERISTDSGRITCHCSHLTNFAILVDFSGQESEPDAFDFALDIISIIGCALSIVSLSLTLSIFLIFRRLRLAQPRKILIQFCFSMLSLYLVFLVGIDMQSTSEAGCVVVAGLLHYFVLSTVLWMGVEARNMYINLVTVFERTGSKFMLKACCFAWGLPLVPVVVVLSVKWDSYIADAYCFLAPSHGLYFGLLLPVAMVIVHNTITFVLVMRRLLKARLGGNVDGKRIHQISKRLQNAFSISILLGLTWVLGFFAIDKARRTIQLLFCVCNSLQGFMVFVLFCLSQDDVRNTVMATCNRNRHGGNSGQSKRSNSSSNKMEKSSTTLNNPSYAVAECSTTSKASHNKDMTASQCNADQKINYDNYDGSAYTFEDVDIQDGSRNVDALIDHVYACPDKSISDEKRYNSDPLASNNDDDNYEVMKEYGDN